MITAELRVGRLLELRYVGITQLEELVDFRRSLSAIAARSPAGLIACCDLRESGIYPEAVAEQLLHLMRKGNGKVLRSGYLLAGQSLFAVQLEAMVLAARKSVRRIFREAEALRLWLGEVMTDEERERLREFLTPQSLPVARQA